MWSLRPFCLWRAAFCLAVAGLLGCSTAVHADPKPLPKEEQARVDKAIDKAIAYLKRQQTKEGNWPTHWKNQFLVGECALPAYALLEAGVPANDPAIQKAAAFIRPKALKTTSTYEISLAVLFLDRLSDPKDKDLIQSLALRLIAGQYYTGGWSYRCPKLKTEQEAALLKAVSALSKRMEGGKAKKEALKEVDVPHGMRSLTIFKDLERVHFSERINPRATKESLPLVGTTDNSNTQFALLALWVAQRHGIPTEPTFRLLVVRFERTQQPNGECAYAYVSSEKFRREGGGRPSMTCVGLLGLAIGRGLQLPASPRSPPAGKVDLRVLAGLAALYATIGVPTGQWDRPIRTKDGYKPDIYFLWSLERVGMLFNLPTLGDKEWYRWGAEVLVSNQLDTGDFNAGDWSENPAFKGPVRGFYGSILKTAFALLFLKHSHPMKELTPKLPFTAKELNAGIARLRPRDSPLEGSTTAAPSRKDQPDR